MSVKSDDNVKDYWFAADDESQEISAYYVCAVAQEPEQIAQTVHDQYIAFYGEGGSVGDVQSITLNGLEGAYFTSLFSQAVVEETEPEATDATADGGAAGGGAGSDGRDGRTGRSRRRSRKRRIRRRTGRRKRRPRRRRKQRKRSMSRRSRWSAICRPSAAIPC